MYNIPTRLRICYALCKKPVTIMRNIQVVINILGGPYQEYTHTGNEQCNT